MSSRQGKDIPIRHLYVEYKHWIGSSRPPFKGIRDELAALAHQGDDFRRIIAPKKSDPLFRLATFLDIFDVRTSYPFLLALLSTSPSKEELLATSETLESYILRRALCGLTTKNYGRVFLQMARALQGSGFQSTAVSSHLAKLTGDSAWWPDDGAFRKAWMTTHAYKTLNNPKIVHILNRLNDACRDRLSEQVTIDSTLTVEHILPQQWIKKLAASRWFYGCHIN